MTTEERRVSKRYNSEEIEGYLKSWKESGKSQIDFSREQGINYYTLNKWINDEKRTLKKTRRTRKGFTELTLESNTSSTLFAEVKREDITILLHQPVSSDFLRSLIK